MISTGEIRAVLEKAQRPHVIGSQDTFLDRATEAVWALLDHHYTQDQIEPLEITFTVKKRGRHLVTAKHAIDTMPQRDDY